MYKIPDTIISINRSESMGVEPLYGKINIRKIKRMEKKYPNTVCFECLREACIDTEKHDGRKPIWAQVYSSYITICDVCGDEGECTESSDAGYPSFKYINQRLRSKKIQKIIDKL